MALSERLAAEKDVLGVSLLPLPKEVPTGRKPSIELMLVVSRMPFDLDLMGMKRIEEQGIGAAIYYTTPKRLETAIDDEAGCWFTSGRVLYGETLHDPTGALVVLRKGVNRVPRERRRKAFDTWFAEASAFPAIAMGRGITAKDVPEMILLRDNAALARALFLLNSRPPRGETWLLDDALALEKLPRGFNAITDILKSMDRLDLRRFERARKVYVEMIAEIKQLGKFL